MKVPESILIILTFFFAAGCSEQQLITDKEYQGTVESVFAEKQKLASNRKEELFDVFNRDLTASQTEALKFLFAFMPLSDLADYSGEFFLANTDVAIRSRNESPWGRKIPWDIFLHYVLPCRVNNENLDSFRIAFYDEIRERIRGMEMEQAAIEINHWCHEKVTYQPSDSRTSAPLSTILSARGRCGEESTFTVSALRTAGIPARQVYTPRWAHTDDNHAWVEIWIDGQWYYMGACEPEPVLDLGWFTEPARRAMLVHTKSFGASTGTENVINQYRDYSEINNTSKYAVTKKIFTKVLDRNGLPVTGALVEYQLYNYAEFYPIATVAANNEGVSSFETGLGDLVVWARKGDDFSFAKISVADIDTVTLKLDRVPQGTYREEYDLKVPVLRTPFDTPSADLAAGNTERINSENQIRQAYVDTWMKPEKAYSLARQINVDTALIGDLITRSMGNYTTIASFLSNAPAARRKLALALLGVIADKDLRDTKIPVLNDHLENVMTPPDMDTNNELFVRYILNPRVSDELLAGWRGFLLNRLPPELVKEAGSNPGVIRDYVDKNITIEDAANYYKTPLTPGGVHQLKVSDTKSRSIYFVALCRTLGIPSRLEPGSNIPQYYFDQKWNDVYFASEKRPSGPKGYLRIFSAESNPVPEYHIHFTIAHFKNGRYNTLDYEFNRRITDFREELQLVPGHYMLVTGNRLNDNKILSDVSFFDLKENQHLSIEVNLRKDNMPPEISGRLDLKKVLDLIPVRESLADKILDKGVVMAWLEPEKEPTKHVLNDLPLLKKELDSWGGGFIFLVDQPVSGSEFKPENYKGLPESSEAGNDNNLEILKTISNDGSGISFPYIILVDKNGNIIFRSSGYRIGIGEQILKNIE